MKYINRLTVIKNTWQNKIYKALQTLSKEEIPLSETDMIIEKPPKPEMGDMAFPMFTYARYLKKSPSVIAKEICTMLSNSYPYIDKIVPAGPYLNFFLKKADLFKDVLKQIDENLESYGCSDYLKAKRVMVEFSSPNTNKPLHLGHLRNDALGYSLSKILEANGAQVKRVNIINDRGIHICKSMLAYQLLGKGKTPESERIKPDHFVGNYYVLYDKKSKEDSSMEQKAREMLKAWEEGDREVTGLWKQMNGWAIDGINETYRKTGIWFDKIYFESETYLLGKEEVLKGLKKGVFYKKEDGSVWVNLSELRMDNKVLLRGDGTSLYVTQDIGTAILRYNDWPFNKLIYIVGSEQKYHFQVLFNVLKLLGFPWAGDLYHLSYGMVNLPEGKMKSREGTVVDADDLLNELKELAKKEIEEKGRVEESGNIEETAEKIALGALNYYLLQTSPNKDMLFNPAESISFNGNTGPYLQYTGARIASIFRKYEERKNTIKGGGFQAGLLAIPEEGELIMLMAQYPEIVLQCAEQYNPSIIANHLYEIASTFNTYYHENQIINNKDSNLVITRLSLARGIQQILKNGFDLLGIPFLECM